MSSDVTGSCLCGAIQYRITGKADGSCHCHCEWCRKTTGAPLVTWATVARENFEITKGTMAAFASSNDGGRSFCRDCGTHITFESKEYPDYLDVAVCTLDIPEKLPPERHIWTRSQLTWNRVDEHLPKAKEI